MTTYDQIKLEGILEGRREAFLEGRLEGFRQEKKRLAIKSLEYGLSMDLICRILDLNELEIQELINDGQ